MWTPEGLAKRGRIRLLAAMAAGGLVAASAGGEPALVLPSIKSRLVLGAGDVAGHDVAAGIGKVFGRGAVESPDRYAGNHPGVPHIVIREDPVMGSCFDFLIHRDEDGDRDRTSGDRQRNEIKGYRGSPRTLQGREGDHMRLHWYFRVGEGWSVTRHFAHFFQLTVVGGDDVEQPLVTLSAALEEGEPVLEFRYRRTSGARSVRHRIATWEAVEGRWLECECAIHLADRGSLRLTVHSADGGRLAARAFDVIDLWRKDASMVRPKWGIYRSLADIEAIRQKEDRVSFADFTIEQWGRFPDPRAPLPRVAPDDHG